MKRSSHILFGGDYNSDQWVGQAEIIKQDFALFEEAKINTLTIGVFSWAALEPEEGRYEFDWMDTIFDRAEQQEMRIILATPSGGKPNWMAMKYPEIRRGCDLRASLARLVLVHRWNKCFYLVHPLDLLWILIEEW